ncbi:MAG: NAD(P)/FAD-dependent oxidoreductase, partial [Muribaculaceae bacterium]|nr:NAD(P)/FAD-dependent oxidoreductase [Muribaculaceae bacterium]MDE5968269.1 NAD(P)/FAD-dependent oxidoreductase [Muribaculaceae bacterium]
LMDLYARKLIQRAAEDFPELPDSIEQYFTSSPLTYEDYTSTPQGAMYGVAKDVTLGAAGRVSHVTRIPNLFLAGQNVNSHGMLGVLIGTTLTAADIIGIDKLKELI